MINNVSSQLSLSSYQASPIAGGIDHLEQARHYQEAFDKHIRNHYSEKDEENLQNARSFYEKAIEATKAELAKDFFNQEKEDLLITIYSEYASFLMRNKVGTDFADLSLSGEFKTNLITIEELYDAALQIAETKQKRDPENQQDKKTLIALYGNYLEVLYYLKDKEILYYLSYKNLSLTKNTTPAFNKINHFLASILEDKREDKELRVAVAQALSKPARLSFKASLTLISLLISTEDMAIRLAAAEALKGCPSFHAGYKLSDGTPLYGVFLPLIILFENKDEDKKIRSAAVNILYRQDKILKNMPDDVISNGMRLGLLSILLDQNEERGLRYGASELLKKHPNMSRIVPLPLDSQLALLSLLQTADNSTLYPGALSVINNSLKPQVKTGTSQK